MKTPLPLWQRLVFASPALWAFIGTAHAQALPWEGPLQTIERSLTGTTARAIGAIALAASGGMLVFGGELGDFTKRVMMVVLALSVMLFAGSIVALVG